MVITLLDGTTVDSGSVTFDPGSYHFYAGTIDITDQLYQADKVVLGGDNYDKKTDNIRLSNQIHPNLNNAGSESVATNFFNGVNSDIQNLATNVSGAVNSTSTGFLMPLAIIVVGAIVLIILAKE